jgi:hypothetical protein
MAVFTVSKKLPSMDSYTVADANGAALYSAKHHLGLTKEHWDIADANGSTVATLTHERQHMHATFVIAGQGLADAKLTKTNYLPVSETWTLDGGAGQATLKGDLADYQSVADHAGWHPDSNLRAQDGVAASSVHRDSRWRPARCPRYSDCSRR